MGVVLARCSKCERSWRVVVFQAKGKRLRNRVSPCCHTRMKRLFRNFTAERIERP